MNKKIIILSLIIFGFIGSYTPMLLGVGDFFSFWSVFLGFIGGLVGIWVGIIISSRWTE